MFMDNGGAGVDSAWEQKKLEARNKPVKCSESSTSPTSPTSSAFFVGIAWNANINSV
jgi:hypothetical protein